jgi:RecB family exonuclease
MTPTTTQASTPSATRRDYVSFTQLDQYLRCPLRYRFVYIDHREPDFVPASRAFGSGIHAAAGHFFRGIAQGQPPELDAIQAHFEALWNYVGDPCQGWR